MLSLARFRAPALPLLLLALPLLGATPGRASRLEDFVAAQRGLQAETLSLAPFRSLGALHNAPGTGTAWKAESEEALRDGPLLALRPRLVGELLAAKPRALRLELPFQGRTLELELARVELFASGFAVRDERGRRLDADLGLHYQGFVVGEVGSFAAISVYPGDLSGMASLAGDGNVVFGRLESSGPEDRYLVYSDRDLKREREWRCSLEDRSPAAQLPQTLTEPTLSGEPAFFAAKSAGPVRISVEVARTLYLAKKTPRATTKYVTTLFNLTKALYANEGIPIVLSELVINTKRDGYTNDPERNLTRYQILRSRKFVGQLAQLVGSGTEGGIAAGFSGFCNADRANSMAASQVGTATPALPTWSYPVEVFAHELGHLMGSRHTHACVWNDNNTAIDGCARYVEGNCPLPDVPASEGTIMSYCRNFSFQNGFGPQPGDRIRSRFAAASCF
jgi:hypothetical protein